MVEVPAEAAAVVTVAVVAVVPVEAVAVLTVPVVAAEQDVVRWINLQVNVKNKNPPIVSGDFYFRKKILLVLFPK